MAIQKHLEGSNSSNGESASAPKAESKPDTASKASESQSEMPKPSEKLSSKKISNIHGTYMQGDPARDIAYVLLDRNSEMSKIVNRDADPSGKNGSVDKLLEKPDTVKYMDETIKSWKDKVKSDIKAHLDNKKDTKAWKERLQFLVDSSSYIESFDQKWQEWKSGQENASTESSDKTSDNTGNKENQTTSKTDIKQFTDKVEQYKKDYDEDSYVDAWYEDAYDETQKMYDNEEITMDEMFEMRQKLVKEREKLSSQKQTKSVIGNDYTQLTTEDESGTPEGEAHNTIVGRLKSMGIKHPTKKDIQQAANDLRDRSIKTIISSYNADTISRNLALANAYGSISNASKLTVERVLKDTLERGSGATREQQCDAISKLCGNGSEYEYESFGDNVSVRASDGDGNPIAVTIEPTVKGLFKVEFVYGDGERGKETYDSIDSVKKATESWIKKEEKHKNPSNADPKKASSNIISMIQASNDINQSKDIKKALEDAPAGTQINLRTNNSYHECYDSYTKNDDGSWTHRYTYPSKEKGKFESWTSSAGYSDIWNAVHNGSPISHDVPASKEK